MTDHAAVTVEEDGIRVEKSFSRDEFPVPAVTFRLVSNRAEPARVRIVDTIPESFPMNQVGFHPDYESENWTAYEDHRVEYERVLDPDEDVLTVFGIRDENPDVDAFLTPPLVEHVPEGEEIENVLGSDSAEPVREVLAGDSDTLPGMDEPLTETEVEAEGPGDSAVAPDAEEGIAEGPSDDAVAAALGDVDSDEGLADESDPVGAADEQGATGGASDETEDGDPDSIDLADPTDGAEDSPDPRTPTEESTSAVSVHEGDDADAAPDPAPDPAAASTESAVEPTDEESAVEPVEAESTAEPQAEEQEEPDAESASTEPPAGPASGVESVAAALADEIRAGAVDDEDLEVLQAELDFETPESVDVRIGRLQSRVEDLSAYTGALEEFIDEEGTAERVLDDVQSGLADVSETIDEMEARLGDAADERATIADDVAANEVGIDAVDEAVERVETTVDELQATVEDLSQSLTDTSEELTDTSDRVADVAGRVDSFDEELGDVWEDVAELDARLTELEDTADQVSGLQSEIDRIDEELADLREFRDSLSDAFGG